MDRGPMSSIKVTHYPKCNDRCDGNEHWLGPGDIQAYKGENVGGFVAEDRYGAVIREQLESHPDLDPTDVAAVEAILDAAYRKINGIKP
jgi:hypothetical protein